MRAREGTTPQHDPLSRSISLKAQERGRSEMLAANVLTVLKARGIAVASDRTEYREFFGAPSSETLVERRWCARTWPTSGGGFASSSIRRRASAVRRSGMSVRRATE